MRRWILSMLLVATACTTATFQPYGAQRGGVDLVHPDVYTAGFQVACDSCRVEYGQDGRTRMVLVDDGWSGSLFIGSLSPDQTARIVLRVQPLGGCSVLLARIDVNGEEAVSAKQKEPGKSVSLTTRVRGS
ncbi:MAG: hypothetical protein LJF04_07635 [Gemmatimonadetes bacterium]|nr:hypothetical protein [Gemmatimonadota bacterium]